MKIRHLLTCVLLVTTLTMQGKNTKTEVNQVTETVTVTDDVDYVIKGTSPFGDEGLVNLQNTEHAVLIIERAKPSVAISTLLSKHVQINGATARNNVNCQVRLYGTMGCMILPYSQTDKPLTVYSEQHFGGESCNDFGLEDDGGYMTTLTTEKLNNRIRSFRLKRGYMVTFATRKSGYGYQRCFIANDQDIEMATLPQILDGTISSYRVFKWNTAGKKGLASNSNASDCDALNVISCYDWGVGHDMQPDVECVANHLYEDFPSSAACGKVTWTSHLKTNNEPRNSADDEPQTLTTILNNWQNLMRTGLRLCSPSSWDGSDYKDGSGFLKEFFDSIDARGWRCDLADLHCYWLIDDFNNLAAMRSKYKRPLWISEWIWGASWNNNGAFESGKTDGDIAWGVQQICEKLNSYGYVERYFYWNQETKGKLISNGNLTQAGRYYANMLSGMGYNSSYEKIPELPPMRGGFSNFRVTQKDGQAIISWHEYDGEYNQLMELLRKEPGGAWQTWKVICPEDDEASYQIVDNDATEGVRYRLHIRSFSGRDYYSSEDVEAGEPIETANGTRYVGGNVIPNGDFSMGMHGWTSGTGEPLAQPWFEVFPNGISGGHFLQALGDQGKDNVSSLKTGFDIVPGQDYLFSIASCNAGNYIKVDTRMKGESSDANKATVESTSYWSTKQRTFNSGEHNEALLAFRWLSGKGQLTNIELCRLFTTQEEAIADGVAQARKRVQAFVEWNTALPALTTELQARESALTGSDAATLRSLESAISQALQAVDYQKKTDSLVIVSRAIDPYLFAGHDELTEARENALAASTAEEISSAYTRLKQAVDQFLTMSVSSRRPQSASFASADGWEVKTGTYKGGDQRTATQEEKSCWNAWWDGISASEGDKQTMEIRQTLGGLPEGLYSLECKAATQHYCLSDQHGYLKTDRETALTPALEYDYLDIPSTPTAWQTLTSTPVYVSANDSLTIGFIGSKQGATDNAWRRYGKTYDDAATNTGDKREGWWCATDFRLLYHPLFKFATEPDAYGTICLPYLYTKTEGLAFYQIAGLLKDYKHICLEEVTELQAGMPYIYTTTSDTTTFYTYGEAEANPASTGHLRGYFSSVSLRIPTGSYVLSNGEWYRVTSDNRPYPTPYSAIIRNAKDMTVIDEWDGPTMVIHDVEDELGESDAIDASTAGTPSPKTYYDAGGRHIEKPAGLHIQVEGKQARKVFAK